MDGLRVVHQLVCTYNRHSVSDDRERKESSKKFGGESRYLEDKNAIDI
jgi:hypothetical protein